MHRQSNSLIKNVQGEWFVKLVLRSLCCDYCFVWNRHGTRSPRRIQVDWAVLVLFTSLHGIKTPCGEKWRSIKGVFSSWPFSLFPVAADKPLRKVLEILLSTRRVGELRSCLWGRTSFIKKIVLGHFWCPVSKGTLIFCELICVIK